jgi:hypothetical protein
MEQVNVRQSTSTVQQFNPKLLTTKKASKYLGIPEATLRSSRTTGLLYGQETPKYKKIGRMVFYPMVELDKWLNSIPTVSHVGEVA